MRAVCPAYVWSFLSWLGRALNQWCNLAGLMWFGEMVVKFLHTLDQLKPILYSHFPCLNRHSTNESLEHNWQELGLALLTSKARIPKGWRSGLSSQPASLSRQSWDNGNLFSNLYWKYCLKYVIKTISPIDLFLIDFDGHNDGAWLKFSSKIVCAPILFNSVGHWVGW